MTPVTPVALGAEKVFIDGRAYYAGLNWLSVPVAANRFLWTEQQGRILGAHYSAAFGGQTGFLPNVLDRPDGIPVAAARCASLVAMARGEWLALVATDGPETLLIQAKDGRILPQGDKVFATPAAAMAAFGTARGQGWDHVFASASLGLENTRAFPTTISHAQPPAEGLPPPADMPPDGEDQTGDLPPAADMDPAADLPLAEGLPPAVLRPLVLRGNRPVVAGLLALATIAAVAGASLWWTAPEEGPVTLRQIVPEQLVVAPTHQDPVRFLEGCKAVIEARPPLIPGWAPVGITCFHNPADSTFVRTGPVSAASAGGPEGGLAVFSWTLDGGNASLGRLVAERTISEGWHRGAVIKTTAWATQPTPTSMRNGAAQGLAFTVFRRRADRVLGPIASQLDFEHNGPDWTMTLVSPFPLVTIIHRLRAADLSGLHIERAVDEGGRWTISGVISPPPAAQGGAVSGAVSGAVFDAGAVSDRAAADGPGNAGTTDATDKPGTTPEPTRQPDIQDTSQ